MHSLVLNNDQAISFIKYINSFLPPVIYDIKRQINVTALKMYFLVAQPINNYVMFVCPSDDLPLRDHKMTSMFDGLISVFCLN